MSWVVRSPPPSQLIVGSLWIGRDLVDPDDPTDHTWVERVEDARVFPDVEDAVACVLAYQADDWADGMLVEPAPISAGR